MNHARTAHLLASLGWRLHARADLDAPDFPGRDGLTYEELVAWNLRRLAEVSP